MVVINLRGTYGSGKTTLARTIMGMYHNVQSHTIEGRKRPLYYTMDHPNSGNPLALIGSYETTCGGCDTINDTKLIFDTVDFLQAHGFDVLYESLLLTADVGRTYDYFTRGWPLNIVLLDLDEDTCIAGVMERRKAVGNYKPLNPKNLRQKITGCKSSCKTLEGRGVPVFRLNRQQALDKVCDMLNLPNIL